jgi:non-ribosomal peptide synthetase component E (peptide arylation enzyme)
VKFIVAPLGIRTIVCAYKIPGVAVFFATTTDRPPVETIERSSKRGHMEPQHGAAMSNLALNLVASAARIPDRIAAITSDQTMTYAELDSASARLATLLQGEGIGVGDRVGVMLPNIAAAPIAYYGIWRMGAIVVPTGKLLRREVIPPPAEEA